MAIILVDITSVLGKGLEILRTCLSIYEHFLSYAVYPGQVPDGG